MSREQKAAKARELRAKGLTLQKIADALGYKAAKSAWQLLNPDQQRKHAQRDNAKRASAKRAWERDPANKVKCSNCGGPTGHTPGQAEAARCRKCVEEETEAMRQQIVDGYRRGDPAWLIAERTGIPVNTVCSEACRLRKRGVDVPLGLTGSPSHRKQAA